MVGVKLSIYTYCYAFEMFANTSWIRKGYRLQTSLYIQALKQRLVQGVLVKIFLIKYILITQINLSIKILTVE